MICHSPSVCDSETENLIKKGPYRWFPELAPSLLTVAIYMSINNNEKSPKPDRTESLISWWLLATYNGLDRQKQSACSCSKDRTKAMLSIHVGKHTHMGPIRPGTWCVTGFKFFVNIYTGQQLTNWIPHPSAPAAEHSDFFQHCQKWSLLPEDMSSLYLKSISNAPPTYGSLHFHFLRPSLAFKE